MTEKIAVLASKIETRLPGQVQRAPSLPDELCFEVQPAQLREVCLALRDTPGLQFEILTRVGMEYETAPAQRWQARFGDLADDLRKALDWALYRRQDAMLGVRLVAAALPLWRELSLLEEGHKNCQLALEAYAREACTDTPLKLKVTVELAIANKRAETKLARYRLAFISRRPLRNQGSLQQPVVST